MLQHRTSNAERLDKDYNIIPKPQAMFPHAMTMPIPKSVAPYRSVYMKTVDIATAAAVATQEEDNLHSSSRNEAEIAHCIRYPKRWLITC